MFHDVVLGSYKHKTLVADIVCGPDVPDGESQAAGDGTGRVPEENEESPRTGQSDHT